MSLTRCPTHPSTPWDVIRSGERVLPPHKVWTHDLIPSLTRDHFHPLSWCPLRHKRLAWYKWLFFLRSRPGYRHYATFCRDDLPKDHCPHCIHRHNLSLHSVLAHCTPSHPLVQAWVTAWQQPLLLQSWRNTANRRDLRIMARLAIPQSVYRFLCSSLGGLRAPRSAVMSFEQTVLDTVNLALANDAPFPPPRRPCPFNIADWRVSPEQ